jgi:Zn-dependent alcohol dehydrogenase
MSGVVEQVGEDVKELIKGDQVCTSMWQNLHPE